MKEYADNRCSSDEKARFEIFTKFMKDILDTNQSLPCLSRKMLQLLCASSHILMRIKWKYKQRDTWEKMIDRMLETIEIEDNWGRLNEHIAILKKVRHG